MKRNSSFSIYREDQPSDAAWRLIKSFADKWNSTSRPQMNLIADEFLRLANIDAASAGYAHLRAGIAQLVSEHGVRVTETIEEIPEPDDLRVADFLRVDGVSLDGLGPMPFTNDRGMGPLLECERCHSADPWSRPRPSKLVIQESLLDGPAQTSGKLLAPPSHGWDFVNLPSGSGLAVSKRAIGWMNELGAPGMQTLPLISAATGRSSARMMELVAEHAFVMPCLEHTAGSPDMCPACGTVLSGVLRQGWSIQRSLVGALSVWSNHRLRAKGLYFAKPLYEGLLARGAQGLFACGFVTICGH